ncbi:MAG: hypothetical protein AABX01_05495 [Candidatus Micrarchaeota archaeon]
MEHCKLGAAKLPSLIHLRGKTVERKAQISLEMLIVMAALAGALIAFSPSIGKISSFSKAALVQKQMEFAVEKIIAGVEEADLMGNGFAGEISVLLPVEMKISYGRGEMMFEYESFGSARKIEAGAPQKMEIGNGASSMVVSSGEKIAILNDRSIVKIKAGPKKG